MGQNVVVLLALVSHATGTPLAHANTMAKAVASHRNAGGADGQVKFSAAQPQLLAKGVTCHG